jgi:2'-5' RNA ligase
MPARPFIKELVVFPEPLTITAGDLIRFLERFPHDAAVHFRQEGHSFQPPITLARWEMYGTDEPCISLLPEDDYRVQRVQREIEREAAHADAL